MPFESPNHTQIPNELLGIQHTPGLMSEMREAELKVVLAICRLTIGFHRYQVKCSLSILEKMTGLSRQGVLNGAQSAEKRGLIRRISAPGRGKLTEWELLTTDDFKNVNEVDQLENGQQNRPFSKEKVNEVDNKSQRSRHMKETKKETSSKKETKGAAQKNAPPPAPSSQKPKTEAQAMFEALANVCQIDWRVCTNGQRQALNQSEKKLRAIRASPDDLSRFGEWWHQHDWRGKKGEAPEPHQVREEWGRFEQNGGNGSKNWQNEDWSQTETPEFLKE